MDTSYPGKTYPTPTINYVDDSQPAHTDDLLCLAMAIDSLLMSPTQSNS